MNQRIVNTAGSLGVILALAMFLSFIDQIILNVAGKTGPTLILVATIANCFVWTFYGFFKVERDWKIVIPNLVGFIVGVVTIFSAFYCKGGCVL